MTVRTYSIAATVACAALIVSLGTTVARADPGACPVGGTFDGGSCVVTLASVTADSTAGSLTGTPVGGTSPITVFAALDQYLPSAGFGADAPDAVVQWDGIIDRIGGPNPPAPGNYGEAKGAAFAPRELNRLATEFPPNTVVLRGVPDDADSHLFVLQSIQPVA